MTGSAAGDAEHKDVSAKYADGILHILVSKLTKNQTPEATVITTV